MSTETPTIPAETANHVLFHFGYGGYQAGSFTQLLIPAIAAADPANQDKLALGFPDYVAAVHAYQYDPDGIANLQRIAAGLRCIRCGDADGPFAGAPNHPLCEPCYKAGAK